MNRFIALFLAVIVAASAAAHGSHGAHGAGAGSGLSLGLNSNLHMHQHEGEDMEITPGAGLTLSYGEGFLEDKLEFETGLSYLFTFKQGYSDFDHDHAHADGHDHEGHDHDHDHSSIFKSSDFYQQVLCFPLGLTYSLDLTYFSKLSFMLENELDFYLSPRIQDENNMEGELRPGIKWSWNGFGDISARYDAPLHYVSYVKEEEFEVGSDVTIGWQSKFGLGIECAGRFTLLPEYSFDGVDVILSYALTVKKFSFNAGCELESIGSGDGIGIVPLIGIGYSF